MSQKSEKTGVVVSNKMQKSIVVAVEQQVRDGLYGKIEKQTSKFMAHDELGATVAKDKVHVHDFHATILHLLGMDHTKLTYRFGGRDYRLTDVHGEVVQALLA